VRVATHARTICATPTPPSTSDKSAARRGSARCAGSERRIVGCASLASRRSSTRRPAAPSRGARPRRRPPRATSSAGLARARGSARGCRIRAASCARAHPGS
jgi:hypothetical protein